MAKNQPLEVISCVRYRGETVPLDSLPDEKQREIKEHLRAQFAKSFGEAISKRPDEARYLLEKYGE